MQEFFILTYCKTKKNNNKNKTEKRFNNILSLTRGQIDKKNWHLTLT